MNFSYKVILKNIIDNLNNKIIIYLYQPIIGPIATSLYSTLISEAHILKDFKKTIFLNERIEKLLGVNSLELRNCIKKLEAVGLLKTLEKKANNNLIFNIYAPLDPIDFFDNKVFNNLLYKKLGKENYELIKFFFRDEGDYSPESGYQDTSAKFSDVFNDLDMKDILNFNSINIKVKPIKSNALLKGLNYNLLINDLNKEGILINKNDHECKKIIEEVFSLHNVSVDLIKEAIKVLYNFETNSFEPIFLHEIILDLIKQNEQQNQLMNNFDIEKHIENSKKQIIIEMETISPEIYWLLLLQNDDKNIKELPKFYNEIIITLQNKYKLRDGLINCLFYFVYLKNKKNIVANYIYKIANTLSEKNIQYAAEALEYLKIAHKKSINKNNLQNSSDTNKQMKSNNKIYSKNSSKIDISKIDLGPGWNQLLKDNTSYKLKLEDVDDSIDLANLGDI